MTPDQQSALGSAMLTLARSEGHQKRHPVSAKRGRLSFAALDVLRVLDRRGPVTGLAVLASSLGRPARAVAHDAARLEAEGLVAIDRSNTNRPQRYEATPAGRERIAR